MKALLAFLVASYLQLLLPQISFAQAFLPVKGEGNYSFSFQNFYTSQHFTQDGTRIDRGIIQENAVIHAVDYGLTHRLAVEVSFPYVFGKYDDEGHPEWRHVSPGNTTDNGHYHGTVADFRFAARYNLEMRPLAITPFIEGVIPSHNYEIFSHSAVGFGLREIRFGVNVGRVFMPRGRPLAFEAGYAFGIPQSHFGIHPNRSTIRSSVVFPITRRLFVSGLQGFQISHGGLDFPAAFPCYNTNPPTCATTDKDGTVISVDEQFYRHAQIWKGSFLNLGIAAGYTLNKSGSVELVGKYMTDVWGRSGHVLNRGLGIGIIYNFRTRYFDEKKSFAARESCGVVCRKCQTIFRPFKRTTTPGR